MKLCFVIMVTELGPPCSSTLMLFGCSLSVHLEWMDTTLSDTASWCRKHGWSDHKRGCSQRIFCIVQHQFSLPSNTSSLPLGRAWSTALFSTVMPYISPRTVSFTISLWSSNHPGALKCFTAVPENVVVSMTGWHQDSPSVFLTQTIQYQCNSVLQSYLDADVDERTSFFSTNYWQ